MSTTPKQRSTFEGIRGDLRFDQEVGYLEHGELIVIYELSVERYMVIEADGHIWWTNSLPIAIPELVPMADLPVKAAGC